MPLRVRLTLWYGALFALILLLVGVLTYALHTRGHYDELDRALVTSAELVATQPTLPEASFEGEIGRGGLVVFIRLYGPDSNLRASSPGAPSITASDPRSVLASPSGPPYDPIAALAPPVGVPTDTPPGSAFGILYAPDQRWRIFVLPLHQGQTLIGYVTASTPLGDLDGAIWAFRIVMIAVGLAGLLIAVAGSSAIAGRALRPVDQMVQTAHDIAQSRSFSRRILVPNDGDELGRLAKTFNQMLDSLAEAYRTQQRFIADASHELRAPLTAIQGNLELLLRQRNMTEAEREEALSEAQREATRLTRLVADLLALARADAGIPVQHRPVDLDAVVLDTFRAARQLALDQKLSLDPFEPVRVEGDEDRLKQLVLILVDNAIKYTPPEGQITLGLRRSDDTAEISVCDTGVGIPPADLPHVFERFYRADPARSRDPGGTGLGLPIAHWIVAQHGGQIDLRSQPGQGTAATVRLPALP